MKYNIYNTHNDDEKTNTIQQMKSQKKYIYNTYIQQRPKTIITQYNTRNENTTSTTPTTTTPTTTPTTLT